jgi:hypothetical protein
VGGENVNVFVMSQKRTSAEILQTIEERIESAHALLESVHEKLAEMAAKDDTDRTLQLSLPRDEISAKIDIGGLSASVSKEFWDNHGGKVKIVILAVGTWAAGWGSKLLAMWMTR